MPGIVLDKVCNWAYSFIFEVLIRRLVLKFVFFLAENYKRQSRKHERLKARNKISFRLSCLRTFVLS